MNEAEREQLDLGPIDQVGFVYRDLEAAVAMYTPLFGPFEIHRFDGYEYNYRGRQAFGQIWAAFARSGQLEIELIQWIAGDTPHKEFLDAGREGMHHVRFPVTALEPKVAAAEALGYRSIWQNRYAEGLAVAYLEREGDPLVVEFFEDRQA